VSRAAKLRLKPLAVVLAAPVAGFIAVAALGFARRIEASVPAGGELPETAVVFTGEFDRIRLGLALLREGRVKRLFISGVNPSAGIRIGGFADQFGLNAALRQALETGLLALGPGAENTSQNAAESACWARARGLSGPILLITSRQHMPRASLALERSLPGAAVIRMSVDDVTVAPDTTLLITEFAKYVITYAATLHFGKTACDPGDGAAEHSQRGQ
jgi:uncharacterized SAM-binding protein YcdF (DUF218 family)